MQLRSVALRGSDPGLAALETQTKETREGFRGHNRVLALARRRDPLPFEIRRKGIQIHEMQIFEVESSGDPL